MGTVSVFLSNLPVFRTQIVDSAFGSVYILHLCGCHAGYRSHAVYHNRSGVRYEQLTLQMIVQCLKKNKPRESGLFSCIFFRFMLRLRRSAAKDASDG